MHNQLRAHIRELTLPRSPPRRNTQCNEHSSPPSRLYAHGSAARAGDPRDPRRDGRRGLHARCSGDRIEEAARVQINTFEYGLAALLPRLTASFRRTLKTCATSPAAPMPIAGRARTSPRTFRSIPGASRINMRLVDDGYGEETFEIYLIGPDGQPERRHSNRPQRRQRMATCRTAMARISSTRLKRPELSPWVPHPLPHDRTSPHATAARSRCWSC